MKASIKNIIFFLNYPFSERDYARFGIDVFEKNGFNVEVWDFTPFLYPRVYESIKVSDPINYSKLRLFKKYEEALNAISGLNSKESSVICFVPYCIRTCPIFRTLSLNKIKYSVFTANTMPLSACRSYRVRKVSQKMFAKEVIVKLRQLTLRKVLDILFFRINLNMLKIIPATFRLAGGMRSILNNKYPVNDKTETLWLHTLDYDIYLNEINKPMEVVDHQGVFLDEYLPFYPAYQYLGFRPFIMKPVGYYRLLCKFFNHLEDKYQMNIIIAAHPRSDYKKVDDYFEGRPVIKGRTAELVRNSSFAIAHASTSLNFAVLFEKPIIFVTTDELEKSPEGAWIYNIAALFGKDTYNLNKIDNINISNELNVNSHIYEDYKNDYIKKIGSEELPFWQIVANRIKDI